MLNTKDIFPLSPFALASPHLLAIFWTMSKYPHGAKLNNTCSYVNDITCWNNLDINKFQLKNNNDMMQCVICNKFSLFTPRLRACEKQKKTNNLVKWFFFLNSGNKKHEFISTWNWDVNNIAMMHLEMNWIKIENWKKINDIKLKTNEIQIDEKKKLIFLWIWCWKEFF
jgi:hypothetical protein